MKITDRSFGPVKVLRPSGSIGAVDLSSIETFRTALIAAVGPGGGEGARVVVDLSGVDYMNSGGLRVLVEASKHTRATPSGKLAVAGLQPTVQEIFQITKFNLVVQVFPTVREAIASMSAEGAAAWDAGGGP